MKPFSTPNKHKTTPFKAQILSDFIRDDIKFDIIKQLKKLL